MGNYAEDYMEGDILTEATATTVEHLFAALNRHDIDALTAAITPDCVLEAPGPPPDGARHTGRDGVRAYWEELFGREPGVAFEVEESLGAGDACAVRYTHRRDAADKDSGHVRAAGLFRVRSGRVAEMRFYVKAPTAF